MRKAFLIINLFIACLLLLSFNSYASGDLNAEELKLYLGEVKFIPVNNPTRVVLGNPNVVDVSDATKTMMALTPKAPGTTTLIFWDNFGEQSYKVKVFAEKKTWRKLALLLSSVCLRYIQRRS